MTNNQHRRWSLHPLLPFKIPHLHPYVPVGVPQFIILSPFADTHHFNASMLESNIREYVVSIRKYWWHTRDVDIKADICVMVLLYVGVMSTAAGPGPVISDRLTSWLITDAPVEQCRFYQIIFYVSTWPKHTNCIVCSNSYSCYYSITVISCSLSIVIHYKTQGNFSSIFITFF